MIDSLHQNSSPVEALRKGWRQPLESLRKGWCPGALAPMLSGDGYIFRLRLLNGVLSFERAKIFAELARRFGNGAFDLSARSNLQMRGVAVENIEPLQRELAALGLLDSDPRAEAVRNLIPSPLAGFDPSAPLDVRPLVAALDAQLTGDKRFHDLPPKFGFSIDGGGALPLRGIVTDIDFTALPGASPRLAVTLGGVEVGEVAPEHVSAAVEGLVHNFLKIRGEDRRMSATVARFGVAPLLEGVAVIASHSVIARSDSDEAIHAAVRSQGGLLRSARNDEAGTNYAKILGAQNLGESAFVGAGLLFGRIDADALETLADEAKAQRAKELRLTPWRTILAVGLAQQKAQDLAARLAPLGFILDADDARLAFAACAGAPACPSAKGDTRALALALAPHWRAGAGRVHVSGCVKGCALHGKALTILLEPNGFSLIENGLARDEPVARIEPLAGLQARFEQLATGARL